MKSKTITPFSNGSECMSWFDSNCHRCAKAFLPNEPQKDRIYQQRLKEGNECEMKYFLELSMITGEVPMEQAQKIGYYNGRMCIMCKEFKQRTHEGELPEKCTFVDPNQMKLF